MKCAGFSPFREGDVAYDIDDDCGENGDAFMRGIESISSRVPWIFVVGDHEGGRKSLHLKDLGGHCGGDYEGLFMRIGMGKGGNDDVCKNLIRHPA